VRPQELAKLVPDVGHESSMGAHPWAVGGPP
jgi:hypothetical protein